MKADLNRFYNGSDGKGTVDSKAEQVQFKFNVIAVTDFNKSGLKSDQIEEKYRQISKENGITGTKTTGDMTSELIAPAAVITQESSSATYGNTVLNIMRINLNIPEGTISHEVGHGLGLDDDYTYGGIMHSPPEQIISSEVDAILRISYDKKN